MNRILSILLIAMILSACGQGEIKTPSNSGSTTGSQPPLKEIDLMIAAETDDEAFEILNKFIAEELAREAFSGIYLEHEPNKHFNILIQEAYPLREVASTLEQYLEKSGKSDGDYPAKLKQAIYSYDTLEKVANELSAYREELIVSDRPVYSFSTNIKENYIELYISSRADLNEELLAEITAGMEGIIQIEEGVMGSVDENGLPTAEPYIVGTIEEKIGEEHNSFLIDDQIFVSVDNATVLKDQEGNTIDAHQFNVGDEVAVWIDGMILESMPAQGYAVAIQLQ